VCWAGFAITYFSVVILVTRIFASGDNELDGDDEGKKYSFDYAAILASASSEIAGTTAAIISVDRIGRVPVQVASYIGGGLSIFAMTYLASNEDSPRGWLILFGFLARMFFMGGSCTTWVITAEILTTEVRATGHSWANGTFLCTAAVANVDANEGWKILTSYISVLKQSLV
jgi:hypothetical protein